MYTIKINIWNLMFIGPCIIITHEITQHISRKLLRMDVLTSETCWALSKEIKQVTSSWSLFTQLIFGSFLCMTYFLFWVFVMLHLWRSYENNFLSELPPFCLVWLVLYINRSKIYFDCLTCNCPCAHVVILVVASLGLRFRTNSTRGKEGGRFLHNIIKCW